MIKYFRVFTFKVSCQFSCETGWLCCSSFSLFFVGYIVVLYSQKGINWVVVCLLVFSLLAIEAPTVPFNLFFK